MPYTARILYWCDSNYPDESKIEQYDLRTNQRSTLASLPSPSQPYGVTVHGNYVYWSDWVKNAVYRVDRFATDPLAEAVGEGLLLGMQGIVSSQVYEIGKYRSQKKKKKVGYSFSGGAS